MYSDLTITEEFYSQIIQISSFYYILSNPIVAISSSPIPGRSARCSGTGLHGNVMAASPEGGSMILREGSEILFFIASQSTMILFTTPSLSQWKVGSMSTLPGGHAR